MYKFVILLFFSLLSFLFFQEVQADSRCLALLPRHNDATENRINIVLHGFGYNDKVSTKELFQYVISNGLFSVEPTASNKSNFNIWYVWHDNLPSRDGIEEAKKSVLSTCASNRILKNVFHVIYSNRATLPGMPLAAADFGGGATISLVEPKREGGYPLQALEEHVYLFLHELVGHAIALMQDEYVLSSNASSDHAGKVSDSKNCFVGSYEQCIEKSPWANMIGQGCGDPNVVDCTSSDWNSYAEVGCYEGCRLLGTGAFRPHDKSIMNEERKDFFGLVQAKEICKQIQVLTEEAIGYCFEQFDIGEPQNNEYQNNKLLNREEQVNKDLAESKSWRKYINLLLGGFIIIGIVGLVFLSKKSSSK